MELFRLLSDKKAWKFIPTLNRGSLFSDESLIEYGLTPNKTYYSLEIKGGKLDKNFILIFNDRREIKSVPSFWFKSIEDDRNDKINQLFK